MSLGRREVFSVCGGGGAYAHSVRHGLGADGGPDWARVTASGRKGAQSTTWSWDQRLLGLADVPSWDVAGNENVLGMETDSESAWFGTSVG